MDGLTLSTIFASWEGKPRWVTVGSVPLSGWSGATGRASGETKAGSWAVWADLALVSDAATLLVGWDGLINRASQAFPRKYIFESSSSLAHLGNSHCRASGAGKNSTWHAANLTCVNSPGPTFQYGAEVCGIVDGGSKWESV